MGYGWGGCSTAVVVVGEGGCLGGVGGGRREGGVLSGGDAEWLDLFACLLAWCVVGMGDGHDPNPHPILNNSKPTQPQPPPKQQGQRALRSCMTMLRMAVRPALSLPATTDRSRSRIFLYVSRWRGLISQKTSVSVLAGRDFSTSACGGGGGWVYWCYIFFAGGWCFVGGGCGTGGIRATLLRLTIGGGQPAQPTSHKTLQHARPEGGRQASVFVFVCV